ncbi:hypothetical protein CI109_104713 [Kwoniella shandongensis]|uniref:Uncharacterized protein n=1 Tax=Kwoniella shandongensis TaxID=1734106 RepID=A0A5M6BPP7_9TREE|nr:uncharacterized protein CI109_006975 [Kwoniella shandongensis]KAA5524717.1 hypothetical protein CI109_006975 [Kwoniella shandongensis]
MSNSHTPGLGHNLQAGQAGPSRPPRSDTTAFHSSNARGGRQVNFPSPNWDEFEAQVLLILVGLPGSGKTTFAESLVGASQRLYHQRRPDDRRAQPFGSGSGSNPNHDLRNTNPPLSDGVPGTIPNHALSTTVQDDRRRPTPRPLRRRVWIRASQDEAPNRRRQECEARVRWGLREGYSVIVDRCGFDPVQRSHFVNIANSTPPHIPRPLIYCLILDVSPSTLETRLIVRPSHPTIPDAETGLRVLRQMRAGFRPPRRGDGEGFDKVFTLSEEEQRRAMRPISGIGKTAVGVAREGGEGQSDKIWWADEEVWSVLDRIEEQGEADPLMQKALGQISHG